MSELHRISACSVQFRIILIAELLLSSICTLSAQTSVYSAGIVNIKSNIRNLPSRNSGALSELSFLTIFPKSLRIYSGEGGTAEIVMISNSDWVLKYTDKWFSANEEKGGGFSQVIFTAKENPEAFERIAKIKVTVKGLPVRIIELSQKARHDE